MYIPESAIRSLLTYDALIPAIRQALIDYSDDKRTEEKDQNKVVQPSRTILRPGDKDWFAVMPESVHMGRRGKCLLQFAIDRNGNVPKLVISMPSGAEPLDRAAVAGISASVPFPPLPTEFKGDQIRLQFAFSYNQ